MLLGSDEFHADRDWDKEQKVVHRNGSASFSRCAAVLPVHPIHRVALEVAANGGTDGGTEEPFANLREKPESLKFVLYGIFEFGKAQLDSRFVQCHIQLLEGVGCGDVHAGDRLCRNDHPAHGSGRFRHCIENTLFEQLGVGEEQGCVPAKEDQTGYLAGVGIARDVVVALDAFNAAQYRRVRTPAIPQELDDGDHDCETYAWDSTKNGHTDETDDG